MALENGPPGGDYVAYIAQLVNQGQAAPGEALSSVDRKNIRRLAREAQVPKEELLANVWGNSSSLSPALVTKGNPGTPAAVQEIFHEGLLQAAPASAAVGATQPDGALPVGQRKVFAGLAQILLGVFVLFVFGATVISLLIDEGFELPELIPVFIVLLVTFQLFRHGIAKLTGKIRRPRHDRTGQPNH